MNQDEKELEPTVSEPEQPEETEQAEETEQNEAGEIEVADSDGEHHHHHHHPHHHHHHKHHSKIYYKYRNAKHQVKKFFRKKSIKFTFAFLLPIIVLAVVVVILLNNSNTINMEPSATAPSISEKQSNVSVVFDEVKSPQLIVNPVLKDYMTETNNKLLWSNIKQAFDETMQKGQPVKFSYQTGKLPLNTTVREAYVLVSKDKNLSNPLKYNFDILCNAYATMLETGQKYYYEIDVVLSDDSTVKSSGSFDTVLTPRLLGFDGPVNVRDIGGWTTEDGKQIKEGVLIRGSEIDGKTMSTAKLSDQDFIRMQKNLGIVYDCDLRSPEEYSGNYSELGQNIRYCQYNMRMYDGVFTDDGKKTVQKLFKDLAKPENYPMYMHCAYGADRTGTVCALLESLLGMKKDNVLKEYQLTGLAYSDMEKVTIDSPLANYFTLFEKYPGNTYKEKAENYLISCGVTEEEIASIRSIFLDN